jgi:hypothetical protein
MMTAMATTMTAEPIRGRQNARRGLTPELRVVD